MTTIFKNCGFGESFCNTVRVKMITGSLVTLESLFPENYCYRYRLEFRMNYHYRYRLGPRSRPFISIDSQLPSRKSFELISSKLPLPLPSWNVFELVWCAGTTPILKKTLRECRGKWKSFGWVRGNSGNRSESCSENCGFCIDQVVRGHSENGISYSENGISNSESCSENTPELSESSENGLFTPRAFFLKLGWSPGFWIRKEIISNMTVISARMVVYSPKRNWTSENWDSECPDLLQSPEMTWAGMSTRMPKEYPLGRNSGTPRKYTNIPKKISPKYWKWPFWGACFQSILGVFSRMSVRRVFLFSFFWVVESPGRTILGFCGRSGGSQNFQNVDTLTVMKYCDRLENQRKTRNPH